MKRWIAMLAAGLMLAIGLTAQAAQGGGAGGRQRLSMDFGWKFKLGQVEGANAATFDDNSWRKLDLPHDWGIEGPFDQNSGTGNSEGYLPAGIGWYRRSFTVPESYRDKQVKVEFDGVYENSEVWINGQLLGKRPFGYISFFYDLTPHLKIGAQNVMAVRVDNSHQPNSRWYSGSGIYRHVWLVVTDKVHVASWGTQITTPDVTADAATVQVKTRLENNGSAAARVTLVTSVLDKDGKVVGTAEAPQDVATGAEQWATQQVKLAKPNLWTLGNPYLYTVRSTVRQGDRTLDEYDTPVGIRSIEYDVNKGFLLNGEHVKMNGVCLHHDAGAVGAAVPEGVWARRLAILKEMGCNAIRTSHNPPAPEFLDLCDQMGFLVMDEAFDEWRGGKTANGYHLYFDEWSERDVRSMVQRDRNHPSVVMWSAGNEIGEQRARGGVDVLKRLVAFFHEEDPTRPVTAGCDNLYAEPTSAPPEFAAAMDIAGYNYVDRWKDRKELYYGVDREQFPQRKFVGTESSGMGGVRMDYRGLFGTPALPPITAPIAEATGGGRGRAGTGPAGTGPAALAGTAPGGRGRGGARGGFGGGAGGGVGRRLDVELLWKFVRLHDYVIGDFMWTGIDYLGESGWPNKGSSSGVIDTCGFKKDGYYFYQSQWTEKPMVHMFPHWNWKGQEGKLVPVTAYTNCDTVELFMNGKSLGVRGYEFPRYGVTRSWNNASPRSRVVHTTSDLHLQWEVPYEAGVLKAVGTKDGQVVVTEEVATTGDVSAIVLAADKAGIMADARDVAHIEVRIVDAQGRMVPTADNALTFEVTGPGKLIGLDNGNQGSHEDYKANVRQAFNGMALAIVQSGREAGKIRVVVKGPGLKEAAVEIDVKPAVAAVALLP